MDLTFRPATAADVYAVLSFWLESAENAARPADSADAVRRLLDRDPDALILALRSGEIVGSVIAGYDGWRCHLYRLAVSPGERRRGVGRRLLEYAEQRLVDVGATRLDAMVLEGNDLGRDVWERNGYAPQPEWRRWVKPL